MWCVETYELVQIFRGHTKAVADCHWSNCGNYILTASDDNMALLWDVKSGNCVQTFKGHTAAVLSCSMNTPSDNLIASGSSDETVRLWSSSSGACIAIIPVHSDPVTCVSFSHDGTLLLTASYDGHCRLWDVATCSCMKTFGRVDGEVIHADFLPNNAQVVLATSDGNVVLHEFSQILSSQVSPHYDLILVKMASTSTGNSLIMVQLDANSKEIAVSTSTFQGLEHAVHCIATKVRIPYDDSFQQKLCKILCACNGKLLAVCTDDACQLKFTVSR